MDDLSQIIPHRRFVITERGVVLLEGEVRLPFQIRAGGLSFPVRETWLRDVYGSYVRLRLDELEELCRRMED